jgi:hypothetical protein
MCGVWRALPRIGAHGARGGEELDHRVLVIRAGD